MNNLETDFERKNLFVSDVKVIQAIRKLGIEQKAEETQKSYNIECESESNSRKVNDEEQEYLNLVAEDFEFFEEE